MSKVTKPRATTGPRGLDKEALVEAAVRLMENAQESGFSLRKLGEQANCDPMALLYHFKSKEGLQRAMAEWLTAQLQSTNETLPWQERLLHLALQYRQLALAYPNTFALLQRFLQTGISDFIHIEMVYRALKQAGVADIRLPDVCLGWYSTVYGLAMAEIGGLTRSATTEELTDIAGLPAERYPLTQQIAPRLSHIDPAQVFRNTLGLLHEGIRVSCARQEARQQAHSAG